MIRDLLRTAAEHERIHAVATDPRLAGPVVDRYVAGTGVEDAVDAAAALVRGGLLVSVDRLGEDVADIAGARDTAEGYLRLVAALRDAGLAGSADLSLKLSSVGQALPGDGQRIAVDLARRIAQAATDAGMTLTLDAEDHTTTDATLATLLALREDFPATGAVLQAMLTRTPGDCADLVGVGSRVRLCKGAYDEPAAVAVRDRQDVRLAYVRCLAVLMAGAGYPMVATHDPVLVDIATALAVRHSRERGSYEFQMLYGVRPPEQRRLAAQGERVRVYLPYGSQWYRYMVRRLVERPANVALFLRSVVGAR